MRMIPGKTKVSMELFKGVRLLDMLIGLITMVLLILILTSNLSHKLVLCIVILIISSLLVVRIDDEPNYRFLMNILRHIGYRKSYQKAFGKKPAEVTETETERKRRRKQEAEERKQDDKRLKNKALSQAERDAIFEKRAGQKEEAEQRAEKETQKKRASMRELMAFTGIADDFVEYGDQYYGAVIQIPPVEFRFFSQNRRTNSIENGLGRVLRMVSVDFGANIVKLERPVIYDSYLEHEYDKLEELRRSFENGVITEAELQARVEVLYDRINELKTLCYEDKVVEPFYYLVLFDSDKKQLNNQVDQAIDSLQSGELKPRRLKDRELAIFLRYTNQIDFDEREAETLEPEEYLEWAMPETVEIKHRTVEVNHIVAHNLWVANYPSVVGDAWLAGLMSIPGTKVVIKCRPMDRGKAMRSIDRSLQELRDRYASTGIDSRRIEIQEHVETLQQLLSMLQGDNEVLLSCNIYVTAYDIAQTRLTKSLLQPPPSTRPVVSNMKKTVRRTYQESGFRLNNMEFSQMEAFVASQISGYDPLSREGRSIPSNSLAAAYPWIYCHVSDENGVKFGSSEGIPVFVDFFRRDSERVNSNMVIVGKSGSGKSYATKSLLTNLAADNAKIFILDPENEYTELAHNLHGKFINVGNAQYGRLNPFHIITALDDDEQGDSNAGSYATHLQFLEEFFRQILPDCEKDALEYLNSLIDRMYTNMGITGETDLSRLKPEDYPVFDDLYDAILEEFQSTDNIYIRSMLRVLMNYISKFSTGGRNAGIWNGPSTVTTDENFTVFNFQSLLANRNGTIANAQMLLVLKYIDNEIIKNRDYNTRNHANRKIVVVIDEAHVFIDTKFPVALDFMFQLAKRIRKYNGMQIVITQNIKDFVGSEEIARKSTAIINACQYSFIFSLAPNDMDDLCRLYEKAGGINENEQEQIVSAPRGQAFTVLSPQSRSSFKVDVPGSIAAMFSSQSFVSRYFSGPEGDKNWLDFMGESRRIQEEDAKGESSEKPTQSETAKRITFMEISEEEARQEKDQIQLARQKRPQNWEPDPNLEPEKQSSAAAVLETTKPAPILTQVPVVVQAAAAPQVVVTPTVELPPVVVQAPPANGDMEQVVMELRQMVENMSKFSYDAIMTEMRRMVGNTQPAEPASPIAEPVISDSQVQTSAQPDSEQEPEAPATYNVPMEDASLPADVMQMLLERAMKLNESSPVDLMLEYDETVIDITLEELMQYNRMKRR